MTIATLGCKPGAQPEPSEPPAVVAGAETDPVGADTREGEYVMQYGEQTIHVFADPELGDEVDRLFLLFGDLLAEQVPLTADTRLPIGWTTLSFAADHQGLTVEEPNYDDEPEANDPGPAAGRAAAGRRARRGDRL